MKALRGAITIAGNSEAAIREGILDLWDALSNTNRITNDQIVSVFFSCTGDIDAAYPGRFVRLERGLTEAAILHFNEMKVQGALPLCIRVLIHLELPLSARLTPVYLKGAAGLRPDLSARD